MAVSLIDITESIAKSHNSHHPSINCFLSTVVNVQRVRLNGLSGFKRYGEMAARETRAEDFTAEKRLVKRGVKEVGDQKMENNKEFIVESGRVFKESRREF